MVCSQPAPEFVPSLLTTASLEFSVPEVSVGYRQSFSPAQGPAEKRSAPLAVTSERLKIIFSLLFLLAAGAAGDRPEPNPGIGSRYPNLHPTEKGLLMTWFEPAERGFTLQWSELSADVWSTPGTIVESDDFFVNWADFPSIYQLGDTTLVVHWLQKSGSGTFDYDVKVVRSTDRGRTWSKPVTPHRDGGPGEHGFVSFFPRPEGDLGLVWLDGRNLTPEGDDYGEMSLYATSIEGNGSLGPEEVLDARVCECCPTAAVATPGGVVVAYRDRSEGEVRDINTIRYRDGGWSRPRAVHDDRWVIAGCPVNGPALAADGPRVALAWYTAGGGKPRVQVAFSSDEGQSFDPPLRVDPGAPLGRVDLIWVEPQKALVSWIEEGETETQILLRTVSREGELGPVRPVALIDPGRISGYPRLARMGDAVLLVWTRAGQGGRVESRWIDLNQF